MAIKHFFQKLKFHFFARIMPNMTRKRQNSIKKNPCFLATRPTFLATRGPKVPFCSTFFHFSHNFSTTWPPKEMWRWFESHDPELSKPHQFDHCPLHLLRRLCISVFGGSKYANFVQPSPTWATEPRNPGMCGRIRDGHDCTDTYDRYSQVTSGLIPYGGVLGFIDPVFFVFLSEKFSTNTERTKKSERLKIIEFSLFFNRNKREIK